MFELFVERHRSSRFGTFGQLFLRDTDNPSVHHPLAYTLEPSKCNGLFPSSVLEGTYGLSVTYSPKFRKLLPLIHVADRDGIRIHAGNTVADTSGCLLVGLFTDGSSLKFSNVALSHVLNVINALSIKQVTFYSLISPF